MLEPGELVIICGTDDEWKGAFYTSWGKAKRAITGMTGRVVREYHGESKKAYTVRLDKKPMYFNETLWFYESMLKKQCIFRGGHSRVL